MMKRTAVGCLLLLTAIAGPRAQGTPLRMEGYPDPGAPATVRLLAPGNAPRTALRFAVPAGYKEHLEMTMDMSLSMEMAGMALPAMSAPAMTTGADVEVTSVAANGDASFVFTFTGLSVAPGGDPALADAMQGADDQLRGAKATGTMTPRGVSRGAKVDLSKVANPLAGQALSAFSSQSESLATPLPEEAVGVGARWEVRQAMSSSGMQIFQRVEYEVVAIDGKTVTLKMKVDQKAPPQAISNPALPPGTDIRLLDQTGAGSGTLTMRLDAMVPTSSMTLQSTASMEVSIGGSAQQMGTATNLKLTTGPKK